MYRKYRIDELLNHGFFAGYPVFRRTRTFVAELSNLERLVQGDKGTIHHKFGEKNLRISGVE